MNENGTNPSLIRECTLIISKDAPDLDTSFVHWGHNSNDANTKCRVGQVHQLWRNIKVSRENLGFDITSVILFVWLIFLGLVYISYLANRPIIVSTPYPPLTFVAIIVSSPVIFSMLWAYGLLRGIILPYVWNWRDNHQKKTLSIADDLSELRHRIFMLEGRLEASNDLSQLYFKTLENILGSEDRAWEEIDVELQRQEIWLC